MRIMSPSKRELMALGAAAIGARFARDALTTSSIHRRYRGDFGGTTAAVIAHLAKYAHPALRAHRQRTRTIAHGA